jgi:hypothetical protein
MTGPLRSAETGQLESDVCCAQRLSPLIAPWCDQGNNVASQLQFADNVDKVVSRHQPVDTDVRRRDGTVLDKDRHMTVTAGRADEMQHRCRKLRSDTDHSDWLP